MKSSHFRNGSVWEDEFTCATQRFIVFGEDIGVEIVEAVVDTVFVGFESQEMSKDLIIDYLIFCKLIFWSECWDNLLAFLEFIL